MLIRSYDLDEVSRSRWLFHKRLAFVVFLPSPLLSVTSLHRATQSKARVGRKKILSSMTSNYALKNGLRRVIREKMSLSMLGVT